ncbi:MAG: AI-2E family transporter [Cyanobacteria bacterium SZAS LIN-3]|nr:AI-2E family transporter [Cyanobacteria bacterium SZAS LIN-3]
MFKLLTVLLVLWFLYLIREVFPPFIVGGIFAYLLLPLVNQISSRLKVPPAAAVAIIYVGALVLIVTASILGGGSMGDQFNALVAQRNEIVVSLVQQVSDAGHWQLDVEHTAADIITSLENTFGSPGEIVHLGGLLSKSLLAVLVCIVSSIYLMIDSRNVGLFLLRFVPVEHHANVKHLSSQMNVMLSNYVRGQLYLIILMSCVAYGFLHFVFHLKFALIIAVLSGFLEIIPVLGPTFAITIATIVGVAQNGVSCAIWIILSYWIARLVEDYVIVPRFIGHAVKLHPLAIIFAVLCGETMAGALGMLIAIPVAASIKEILDFFYPAQGERPHGTPPATATVPLTGAGASGTIPEPTEEPPVHDVKVTEVDVDTKAD